MMSDYHNFVFDREKRSFVGEFEAMYQGEQLGGYDSWNQDDVESREDAHAIQNLLGERRFDWLVDLGCGKGALTKALSHIATRTLGVDTSETAISVARERYSDLTFLTANLNSLPTVSQLLKNLEKSMESSVLVVMSQVLSYLPNWKELIREISKHCSEFVITLYLPLDPIGFVKSATELEHAITESARVLFWHEFVESRQYVILATTETAR